MKIKHLILFFALVMVMAIGFNHSSTAKGKESTSGTENNDITEVELTSEDKSKVEEWFKNSGYVNVLDASNGQTINYLTASTGGYMAGFQNMGFATASSDESVPDILWDVCEDANLDKALSNYILYIYELDEKV